MLSLLEKKMLVNAELIRQLRLLAAYYRYSGNADRFRALAYARACKEIKSLNYDVTQIHEERRIDAIPGIGESILLKIKEFQQSGRIAMLDIIAREVPLEWLELSMLRGIGSQTLKKIRASLQIETRMQLSKALESGQILTVPGIGQKKADAISDALHLHADSEQRMLLNEADDLAEEVMLWMRCVPGDWLATMAGSLRRREETIGDLDLLIACEKKERSMLIHRFLAKDFASKILVKGQGRCSIIHAISKKQIDLRILDKEQWGSGLQYFTGSKQHNIHLRGLARDAGYRISEYGIKRLDENVYLKMDAEETLYRQMKMDYIPPELRQDEGEIEAALNHTIPKLVNIGDMRGDFQMHTTWSDGKHTLEEMVDYARRTFDYEYIVITEHSKSSRIAGGMSERQIEKQIKAIDKLNKKLGLPFVKSGIEVDILADGSLDIADELLEQLDWVTASIHSGFTKDNTERLIRACEHPLVACIGHPTGRLIGTRSSYKLDMDEVIQAAKRTGTVLEINAQPNRLDLNASYARQAAESDVLLSIGSDAHDQKELHYMKYGVDAARRAWLTRKQVANTYSWSSLAKVIKKGRRLTSISARSDQEHA